MNKRLLLILLVTLGFSHYPINTSAQDDSTFDFRFRGIGEGLDDRGLDLLRDLDLRQVHMYRDGIKKGEGFIWITKHSARPFPDGTMVEYHVFLRPEFDAYTDSRDELIYSGNVLLSREMSTIVEIPRGVLPEDGKDYTLYIEINNNRNVVERTHNNNWKRLNWRFDRPAIITIDNLFVRENCDRRSPGEWRMMYNIESNRRGDPWRIDSNFFDTEDYTNYPTDPEKKGFATFLITNLPIDRTLTNRLSFADCNKYNCERDGAPPGGTEEGREHWFGAAHDSFTGWATADISPDKRFSGEAVHASTDLDDCGFTATFRLMEPGQAREQGYEYERVLTPRW